MPACGDETPKNSRISLFRLDKRKQVMKRRNLLCTFGAVASIPLVLDRAAAQSKEPVKSENQFDVVVLGGGFAGLTAAVALLRQGLKPIIVEKRRWLGGDGLLSAGIIISAKSKVHEEAGLVNGVSQEDYWNRIQSGVDDEPLSKVRDNLPLSPIYSGVAKHDPEVLRRCAYKTPQVVDFMLSYGVEFIKPSKAQPFLLPTKPGSMNLFTSAMVKELKAQGVSFLLGYAAKKLMTKGGEVVGVEVEEVDRAQNRQRITAQAVLIATGGFADNPEMMKRYKRVWSEVPQGFTAIGEGVPKGHDGDGIIMGKQAGAAVEDMESIPKFYAAPVAGKKAPSWILFDTDTAYLVGKDGRRFTDEHKSRYGGCALIAFSKNIKGAHVVLDEETFKGSTSSRWGYQRLLEEGFLHKGDTIEQAAIAAGIDPKGLSETLARIEKDSRNGKDTEYGRADSLFRPLKGPFYISEASYPVRFKTEGGLEVNPNFEVIAASDETPIKGLYAAGAACGSISTRLSDVIGSGLMAGESIARSVVK